MSPRPIQIGEERTNDNDNEQSAIGKGSERERKRFMKNRCLKIDIRSAAHKAGSSFFAQRTHINDRRKMTLEIIIIIVIQINMQIPTQELHVLIAKSKEQRVQFK